MLWKTTFVVVNTVLRQQVTVFFNVRNALLSKGGTGNLVWVHRAAAI